MSKAFSTSTEIFIWFLFLFLNVEYHMIDLHISKNLCISRVFFSGSNGKLSACNAGDPNSIPESGGSPGEGNGNTLQYSCLENSMDGGAWWATVHGVTKSQT